MSELKEKKSESKAAQAIKAYAKTKAGIMIIGIMAMLCVLTACKGEDTVDKTKMAFSNIGELATQECRNSQIGVVDGAQEVWGVKLPFTTTKIIFTYDVETKAGYDFASIEWSVDEKNKAIEVQLPEAKILSNAVVTGTCKVYHEERGMFAPFDMEAEEAAKKELEEKAQAYAVENGLLVRARENAEVIIRAFFSGVYDLNEYTVEFVEE